MKQNYRKHSYRFPVYPQATIKLFMFVFDLAQSKQDFANIHVSLGEIGQNILKAVLAFSGSLSKINFKIMYCNFCIVVSLLHSCFMNVN